jgi:hypothetical protein
MALGKARRVPPPDARPDGVVYRQQYVRCGKPGCRKCPPQGPGHGPYWYGFYWDYRQRTRSFYVGKVLPPGVEPLEDDPGAESHRVADEVPGPPA